MLLTIKIQVHKETIKSQVTVLLIYCPWFPLDG
jgi:hypothetical protein